MSDERFAEPLPANAKTYICMAQDLPDSKRAQVRARHLEKAAIGNKSGHILQGGAFLTEPDAEGQQTMTGSFIILKARDLAHARDMIEKDIYMTGGAWDINKTTICETKLAFDPK